MQSTAGTDAASAYADLAQENETLRKRIRELEKSQKKRKKRGPNAYQIEWKNHYRTEVEHAKSEHATNPAEEWLQSYSKQYPSDMNTAPNPKRGEGLAPADRKVFMANVGARTKRALAAATAQTPPPPTGPGGDPSDHSAGPGTMAH